MSSFELFDLHPSIKTALKNKGYETPTPIQAEAIPHLLEGRDLLGIAQTGTGKTAAFSLPIIHRLVKNKVKAKPARVRALILTPTRELASQIEENINVYSKDLRLNCAVIFGGVGHRPQITKMGRGVDILVATPGRLLDLMNDGHVLFDQLEVFVLDEADRMLDMGFIHDVKKIISKIPTERQTLLFSATMPKDIASLASKLLKEPVRVEVTPESTTVEKIESRLLFVDRSNKSLLLKSLLEGPEIKSVLVFTRTKHGANRVVKNLTAASISAAAIHGNKSQSAREKALSDFRSEKIRVLVATDIVARGIDVSHVGYVINYDLPDDAKSYVHRIGRTARAGRSGVAISFCDDSERGLLKDIEKLINMKIPVKTDHPYHGAKAQMAVTERASNGGRPAQKTGNRRRTPRSRNRRPSS